MAPEFGQRGLLGKSSVGTVEPQGYFVGNFIDENHPEHTTNCEIAILRLPTIDDSNPHFHETMTEVTYVISGELELLVWDNGGVWGIKLHKNQYLLVEPGVIIQNPKNTEGTQVFVVKFPSKPNDKKYIEQSKIDDFLLSG